MKDVFFIFIYFILEQIWTQIGNNDLKVIEVGRFYIFYCIIKAQTSKHIVLYCKYVCVSTPLSPQVIVRLKGVQGPSELKTTIKKKKRYAIE